MSEIRNIYEKLSLISEELSTVAKNLEVGIGQNKYKAVGEADVLRAVKPLERKYKVYSYPYSRKIIDSGVIESTTYKGEIKKNLYERIETVYRFVNIENPVEYIDITTYGDGIDTQDKSVGKAMTYADKYALLKAYKIITGEDPDQNASEDLNSYNKTYESFEDFPQAAVIETKSEPVKLATQSQLLVIKSNDTEGRFLPYFTKKYGVDKFEDLTYEQADKFIKQLTEKRG